MSEISKSGSQLFDHTFILCDQILDQELNVFIGSDFKLDNLSYPILFFILYSFFV